MDAFDRAIEQSENDLQEYNRQIARDRKREQNNPAVNAEFLGRNSDGSGRFRTSFGDRNFVMLSDNIQEGQVSQALYRGDVGFTSGIPSVHRFRLPNRYVFGGFKSIALPYTSQFHYWLDILDLGIPEEDLTIADVFAFNYLALGVGFQNRQGSFCPDLAWGYRDPSSTLFTYQGDEDFDELQVFIQGIADGFNFVGGFSRQLLSPFQPNGVVRLIPFTEVPGGWGDDNNGDTPFPYSIDVRNGTDYFENKNNLVFPILTGNQTTLPDAYAAWFNPLPTNVIFQNRVTFDMPLSGQSKDLLFLPSPNLIPYTNVQSRIFLSVKASNQGRAVTVKGYWFIWLSPNHQLQFGSGGTTSWTVTQRGRIHPIADSSDLRFDEETTHFIPDILSSAQNHAAFVNHEFELSVKHEEEFTFWATHDMPAAVGALGITEPFWGQAIIVTEIVGGTFTTNPDDFIA